MKVRMSGVMWIELIKEGLPDFIWICCPIPKVVNPRKMTPSSDASKSMASIMSAGKERKSWLLRHQ